MKNLAEFGLILESDRVERAPQKIFDEMIGNYYKEYYMMYPNQLILSHWSWICYEEVMTFLPKTSFFD